MISFLSDYVYKETAFVSSYVLETDNVFITIGYKGKTSTQIFSRQFLETSSLEHIVQTIHEVAKPMIDSDDLAPGIIKYVSNINFMPDSPEPAFDASLLSIPKGPGAVMALPHMSTMVKHPIYPANQQLMLIIMNLNDHFKWTREAIADWLDTLDLDLSLDSGIIEAEV